MKFTANKNTLQNALNIAGLAIGKSIVPALENYLFSLSGAGLTVSASNLEVFISTKIEVESTDSVDFMVPASRLSGLIKELSDVPLLFTLNEKEAGGYDLLIQAGRGKYTIPCGKGEEFPTMKSDPGISFSIPYEILLPGIEKTLFACSKDDLMPAMTGMLFDIQKDNINLVAVDGTILSSQKYAISQDQEKEFIVPQKVLSIIHGSDISSFVDIELSDRNISFIIDDVTIIRSILIDEKFPNWKAVIPTDNPIKAKVDRSELISALKRVKQFSNSLTNASILDFSEGSVSISSENQYGEHASEEIECETVGGNIRIGVNGSYFLSLLTKMDASTVTMEMSSPKRAILMNEENSLMLLMPVMI